MCHKWPAILMEYRHFNKIHHPSLQTLEHVSTEIQNKNQNANAQCTSYTIAF